MAHTGAPLAFKQDVEDRQDERNILHILYILLIFLGFTLVPVSRASATAGPQATPTPQTPTAVPPPMSSFLGRLAPPPTVYPPTQADQGAQVYYLVCMACHGDRGQGLTDEWRSVLDPGDRDCWQSHCHASNHPLDGFVFPKFVPAIIGPGELAPFRTALNLHDYLQARMPWQAPGNLTEAEYWQLTAYLIRANGFDPGQSPLDSQRAALINLGVRPTLTPTPARGLAALPEIPGMGFWIASGGILALVGLVVLVILVRRTAGH